VPVVFTTAYDKYALKAFDINSIHYLLKPVNKEGLAKALDKYHTQNRVLPRDLMAIGELLASARNQFKTRFLGKHGNKLVHKETSSIAYFYSSERMVYIVDRERKKYLLDYTLEELAEQYLNPMVFYRVSRQFIVNINVVEVLKKYSQQRLQLFLKSGQEHEIVVSREKVSDFKNWLNK
jgi:two-component system response regulator LytT